MFCVVLKKFPNYCFNACEAIFLTASNQYDFQSLSSVVCHCTALCEKPLQKWTFIICYITKTIHWIILLFFCLSLDSFILSPLILQNISWPYNILIKNHKTLSSVCMKGMVFFFLLKGIHSKKNVMVDGPSWDKFRDTSTAS